MLTYCIQSEGLVNNYFITHCFHGYNSALSNESNKMAYVCSKVVMVIIILYPQELHGVHPYKEGLYHIQNLVYLSNNIVTGYKWIHGPFSKTNIPSISCSMWLHV